MFGPSVVSNTSREDDPRICTGIVEHCEHLHTRTTRGSTEHNTYYFHLVPLFWRTTQRRNHRIFQQKTLPNIVKELLETDWQLTPK